MEEAEVDSRAADHDADDLEHARERTKNLEKLVRFMKEIAAADRPEATATDAAVLSDAGWDISCGSEELLEMLSSVAHPGERGDIIDRLADVLEAAFDIGRYASPSEGVIRAEARLRRSADAKKAGENSGAARRQKSQVWVTWCIEEARKLRQSSPAIGPEQLATKLFDVDWPPSIARKKKEWRTILEAIRRAEAAGDLKKKLRV